MSDGDAFEFNNTVHGDGAQINQGKNVTATPTNQLGDQLTFDKFAAAIERDIATDCAPDQAEVVREDVLKPLREIAAQEEPTNEQDRTTLKARIMELLEKLEPYAPYIRKTIAAFAEGALMTLPPPAGWIIAGCIEVVRDARNRD
jgi:hypothetical protein